MDKAELIEKIEKAAFEEATELFLDNMGVNELPKQIGKLVNLQRLNLFNNQLSTLPEQIGNLVKLQELGVRV